MWMRPVLSLCNAGESYNLEFWTGISYQIFGEEVVNDDDIEIQELCHGMENVGGDGLEILHQMDVLSAEAQEH